MPNYRRQNVHEESNKNVETVIIITKSWFDLHRDSHDGGESEPVVVDGQLHELRRDFDAGMATVQFAREDRGQLRTNERIKRSFNKSRRKERVEKRSLRFVTESCCTCWTELWARRRRAPSDIGRSGGGGSCRRIPFYGWVVQHNKNFIGNDKLVLTHWFFFFRFLDI